MRHDDPAHMSIDERLDEVASLLAAGFLRLRRRTGCLPSDASPPTESIGSTWLDSTLAPEPTRITTVFSFGPVPQLPISKLTCPIDKATAGH